MVAAIAQRMQSVGHARFRSQALAELYLRKLSALRDYTSILEVLGARQRTVNERRARDCDPSFKSDAWPKLQRALEDQRVKEDQVKLRKRQLANMEMASQEPDQIAHIRALLQEVTEAEVELEENRHWLAQQESVWVRAEEEFQQERRRRDLAGRQRIAAMLLERRRHQQRQGQLMAETVRIQELLLDLEESLSTSRQRGHEYDQELSAIITEKEGLLQSLTHAVSNMKEQCGEVQAKVAEGEEALARMSRLAELDQTRLAQQEEVESLEKKVADLRAKHNVVVVM